MEGGPGRRREAGGGVGATDGVAAAQQAGVFSSAHLLVGIIRLKRGGGGGGEESLRASVTPHGKRSPSPAAVEGGSRLKPCTVDDAGERSHGNGPVAATGGSTAAVLRNTVSIHSQLTKRTDDAFYWHIMCLLRPSK